MKSKKKNDKIKNKNGLLGYISKSSSYANGSFKNIRIFIADILFILLILLGLIAGIVLYIHLNVSISNNIDILANKLMLTLFISSIVITIILSLFFKYKFHEIVPFTFVVPMAPVVLIVIIVIIHKNMLSTTTFGMLVHKNSAGYTVYEEYENNFSKTYLLYLSTEVNKENNDAFYKATIEMLNKLETRRGFNDKKVYWNTIYSIDTNKNLRLKQKDFLVEWIYSIGGDGKKVATLNQ